uniref:Scavenger receptor class B member 2 n=1 Tax=Leptobrachium leishanense TaxID=445787 RepID=A0A8C5P7E6_9ANUR
MLTVYASKAIDKATVLKNGSEIYEDWVNPPPEIYMQFYFYNVTNPLEILSGEKPILREIGPYTYREYRSRESISFLENGTTVSAVNRKVYVFDPEKSVGNPQDYIRTVNIPIMTLLETLINLNPFLKPFIEEALMTYKDGLFVTHSVHEWLWGYRDAVLAIVNLLDPNVSDTFGLFYLMNSTDDGEYVFLSGSADYMEFTQILEWRGKTSLDWWTTDTCNMINGTDGSTVHSLVDKDDIINIFPSDLCRSLSAVYDRSETVKNIPVYRFTPSASTFANVTLNPDNAGFCVPSGNCLPSGLLNVSKCKQGAPIVLSFPHFYQADESIVQSIENMQPNKENDETFLDINPLTGALIQVAKRIQVNVHLRKLEGYESITKNIQTLFFPVMHLNESFVLDDNSVKKLSGILLTSGVVANVPFIILAVGILLGIIFIVLVCRPVRSREEVSEEDERGPLIRTS